MNNLDILLEQTFVHMVGSEQQADDVIENYKSKHSIKKATTDKKVKKGMEYWKVTVVVEHASEKDSFDAYFGE